MRKLMAFVFLVTMTTFCTKAQDSLGYELKYGVHRVYDGFSLTYPELDQAQTLSDLNEHYPADYVKEYESVEISTYQADLRQTAVSSDANLSPDQLSLIQSADSGSTIEVKVRYLPDNQLTHNEIKEMSFEFVMEPQSAEYPGGHANLLKFLKENGIGELSSTVFRQHHLTAANFTIDENGLITDVYMTESSGDPQTDAFLIKVIRNMPQWKPARYADGSVVAQPYVLTIGDHNSCVINLLKVRTLTSEVDKLNLVKVDEK